MKSFNRLFGILFIIAMLVAGCRKEETVYTPTGPDISSLTRQYKLAVMDAKVAEPWEICRDLVAVNYYGDSAAGAGNLTWSTDSTGKMRLLVTSWMSQSSTKYWPVGQTFKTSSSQAHLSWITTAPQMAVFLKKHDFGDQASLHLRIAQALGMPPTSPNDYFVEFWVYPENIFRPSPDPEITDPEAGLYFPSAASQKHRNWFLNQVATMYDTSSTSSFPWTRLGYTYDWANPLHPVGMSEFVVDTSSVVTVKHIYSSWEYYQLSLVTK